MFKKNETYKQLNVFAINTNLSKKQKKLWDKSKEHCFFHEVFSKIDESLFSVLYSDKKSRPNTPVNQLVGAIILKHIFNWTYEQLFTNLNFNSLTRHAIGINRIDEDVFCEASIFNFQNKLIAHRTNTGEDLLDKVFRKITAEQIKFFGVNTSVQRGDSFMVGSNIVDYSRLQLLVEVLIRLKRILTDSAKESFKEELVVYTKYTSTNYIYNIEKKDLAIEMKKIGAVYARLYLALGAEYESKEEHQTFKRVFEEHFKIDSEKKVIVIALEKDKDKKKGKDQSPSPLQSPDDLEATYITKNRKKYKGYVTHLSETVNPDNEVNLITDVVTYPNNVGDAEILEDRLPKMKELTPALNEYFVDGLYGNPGVDTFADEENITLYQKTRRGRKSPAGKKITEDEAKKLWASCNGGQRILASITKDDNYKAEFDQEKCRGCKFNESCSIRHVGGKTKAKRRIYYFKKKDVLAHARMANIEKLEGKKKYSRSNVEATVKETKRGMKNGKVRIRGRIRVSLHMIFTVIGINLVRIHKKMGLKVQYWSDTLHVAA